MRTQVIEGMCKTTSPTPIGTLVALYDEWLRFTTMTAPDEEMDRLIYDMIAIEDTFAVVPSSTLVDAAIKAKVLAWREKEGSRPAAHRPDLVASLSRDLDRLAGGVL